MTSLISRDSLGLPKIDKTFKITNYCMEENMHSELSMLVEIDFL